MQREWRDPGTGNSAGRGPGAWGVSPQAAGGCAVGIGGALHPGAWSGFGLRDPSVGPARCLGYSLLASQCRGGGGLGTTCTCQGSAGPEAESVRGHQAPLTRAVRVAPQGSDRKGRDVGDTCMGDGHLLAAWAPAVPPQFTRFSSQAHGARERSDPHHPRPGFAARTLTSGSRVCSAGPRRSCEPWYLRGGAQPLRGLP